MVNSWSLVKQHLIEFLKDEVYKTGIDRVIVGLSGGLDSAVVAVLLQEIFKDKFLAVMMPTQYSSESSLKDSQELIDKFGIRSIKIDISEYLEVFNSNNLDSNSLRKGNFSARVRMIILYDLSAKERALVIGTSNKSELLLGYGTIFGDLASALNPIGDIYKSDLFSFAKFLGVPDSIIDKPPSADLFDGQSDEKEIGYTYVEIDRVFKLYVEDRLSVKSIVSLGEDKNLVNMLVTRMYRNHFKRKMPIIVKLTDRTFGHDFLYGRDVQISDI